MLIKDLPDTEYHALPHIGSTTAQLGIDNWPLLLDAMRGDYKMDDKPCFVAGRLLHMAVLEPARFRELVVSHGPINEKTGEPYGRATKKFEQWQLDNPELTMVDPWIYKAIERMPDAVKNIFAAGGEAETTCIIGRHDGHGWKCRPDWWNREQRVFYDLKSISTKGGNIERAIDRAVAQRKYWFTTAWYAQCLYNDTQEKQTVKLIFVEKELPHRWRIVDLDYDYLCLGEEKVTEIRHRIQVNDWSAEAADDIFYQSAAPHYLLNEEESETE